MRKTIAILLIAIILIGISGCKKKKGDDTSSDSSSNISSSSSELSSYNQTSSDEESSSAPTESTIPTVAEPIDESSVNIAGLAQYENNKKGWGQGVQVDGNNRPVSCDEYQSKFGEFGGLFIMPAEEKKMYLTFDEGYENGYTANILDTLKAKDCKAVFFVTMPYVKGHPELIARMIDEGHVIGNHSVTHQSMPLLTTQQAINEITGLHNYMVENYNYTMTLFRPPMGEWSTRTFAMAKELGYQTVLWSFAYIDYYVDNQMGTAKAFPKITSATHNGAIYLLHAVSKDNAAMMGALIDDFRQKGYTLDLIK